MDRWWAHVLDSRGTRKQRAMDLSSDQSERGRFAELADDLGGYSAKLFKSG